MRSLSSTKRIFSNISTKIDGLFVSICELQYSKSPPISINGDEQTQTTHATGHSQPKTDDDDDNDVVYIQNHYSKSTIIFTTFIFLRAKLKTHATAKKRSARVFFQSMAEVGGSTDWEEMYNGRRDNDGGGVANSHDWRFQVSEFAKGAAEMSVEFGKGVRDVVRQSLLRDDSVIMKKYGGPCAKFFGRFRFLNEYLPEDRDPVHAWSVILCVWVFAFSALIVNTNVTATHLVKKMKSHPPSAGLILLPDGRHLAYREQGVPADLARYSIISTHSFLSSRLEGIPGIKHSLLQEFGVRLITYDLPGFGESDPHPDRDLESSAVDILHLSYALNITDKFWVLGYSEGSMHTWAALRYIPDRVEGAFVVAPMVNPYERRLTKAETRNIWKKWTTKKKLMYFLARKIPKSLVYFYRRSFLSGNHGEIDECLSLSLGKRDKSLVDNKVFEEFHHRNVEESVRQAIAEPFVEEVALLVSDWGFNLADLKAQNKHNGQGIISWLKSMYSPTQESMNGFLGSIHIWQGMEDTVVPPSMSDFVRRVLPDVMVHKLPYEGHFTYFYFCDECHRQMLTAVLGNPQGPLTLPKEEEAVTTTDEEEEENMELESAI